MEQNKVGPPVRPRGGSAMRVWIDQDLCTGDGLCTDHDWSAHHERVADRDLGRATRWNLVHGVED
jgi:hypothetical protein